MNIILVRHGESEFNVGKSESVDSHLTDKGFAQAHETAMYLGRYLDKEKYWTIIASPYIRTFVTANIIRYTSFDQSTLNTDIRIAEYLLCRPEFFQSKIPYSLQTGESITELPTAEQTLENLKNFWNDLDKDRNYIIVSHGIPIMVMVELARGKASIPQWDKAYVNCAITHISNNEFKLHNYTGHLENKILKGWNK